jgi:hypothetical protein
MNDSPDTRPVPAMKGLEAAALGETAKMLEKDGGKMPSMEAVELAARMMAAKVHRELNAQQSQEQKQPEPKRQGGLKISPSTFNQGVTDNWRAESLDWGLD